MALSARVGQLPCPARPLFAQKAMREVPVGHRCRPSAGDHPGLSPRPVWLQLPPSAQSMGGETNTERWGLWGPTLGLQPAAPHGTSLRVCVCVCVCVCVRGMSKLSTPPALIPRLNPGRLMKSALSRVSQRNPWNTTEKPVGPAQHLIGCVSCALPSFLPLSSLPTCFFVLFLVPLPP